VRKGRGEVKNRQYHNREYALSDLSQSKNAPMRGSDR